MESEKYRKILLVDTESLKDVLSATPAITILRERFKFSQIDFLTENKFVDILTGDRDLNSILSFDRNDLPSIIGVIKKVREERYDLLINFSVNKKSQLINLLSKANYRVGYNHKFWKLFYDLNVIPEINERCYLPDYKLLLLSALGIKTEKLPPFIFIPKDSREQIKNFISKKNISETEFIIGISVCGIRKDKEIKKWFKEVFAGTIKLLAKSYSAKILIIWQEGQEKERDLAMLLLAGYAFTHPSLKIKSLAALIKKCKIIISCKNDIDNLAVTVGVNTITITVKGRSRIYSIPQSDEHVILEETISFDNSAQKKLWNAIEKMLINLLRKKILKSLRKGI